MSAPVFRRATVSDYRKWLRWWLLSGMKPTHYYDYPFDRWTWLYALQDFRTGGECGAKAVNIVVPPGVKCLGGGLGHNNLFFMGGMSTARGGVVPVFNDPEFTTLFGVRRFIRREQDRAAALEAEWRELSERANALHMSGDIGPFLAREANGEAA
jgi:hypothetical protein